MSHAYILTLTGPDRIGLVEEISQLLLEYGGNVETSRMARLGGEFAMLLLVSLPPDRLPPLEARLQRLAAHGLHAHLAPTEAPANPFAGWLPYRIEVEGADHEGIIHEVARYLSQHRIHIESLETDISPAPITGAPIFNMSALVLAPPDLDPAAWTFGLSSLAHRENLALRAAPITPA
jgi:glycine cleavage system transcriptional repressor